MATPVQQATPIRMAAAGMDSTTDPALVPPTAYVYGVNCEVENQLPTTRKGFRRITPTGNSAALDYIRDHQFQGATYYNPGLGLSQIRFSTDEGHIVFASGGRYFKLTPKDDETTLEDITFKAAGYDEDQMLVYLYQAENFAIAQVPTRNTWIYDGTTARDSVGLKTGEDRADSEIANLAGPGLYAHGRIIQAVGSRVLIGDIIFASGSFESAESIIKMTEQTYLAEGSYFAAPSMLGKTNAITLLPLRNTQHGHGDIIYHNEFGSYSINNLQAPREQWATQAVARHVLLDSAATGPYAVTLFDGDQIFRSRHGVQTLRSAAAESEVLGNAFRPISDPVREFMRGDPATLLQYASVERRPEENRLFVTTGLHQHDLHRGGRGFLSINFYPVPGQPGHAWEGVQVPGNSVYLVNQIVTGRFENRERTFLFVTFEDLTTGILEYDQKLINDEIDGTTPIPLRIVTREETFGFELGAKAIADGVLDLKNVKTNVRVRISMRTEMETDWHTWRVVDIDAPDSIRGIDAEIRLGNPPPKVTSGDRFQFMIEVVGAASIYGLRVTGGGDAQPGSGRTPVSTRPSSGCKFNPFEKVII